MGRIARYKDDQERAIKEAVERERMKNMTEEERKALERERHMVRQACRWEHALGLSGLDGLAMLAAACTGHVQVERKALKRERPSVRQACCSRMRCLSGEQPGRPPWCCRHEAEETTLRS